jgi:hypothetical protein
MSFVGCIGTLMENSGLEEFSAKLLEGWQLKC